jgi:adenosine 3'-phospho 5'-phosphosulfate transporter B2
MVDYSVHGNLAEHARRLRCIFFGVSIVASLLVYGLWQERIMALPYQKDFFNISVFLVLFNRVFGIVLAIGMVQVSGEPCCPSASVWKYVLISMSTLVASLCQYEALKYVSFAVQVLGKSFKMMPIMLWGLLAFKRKYRFVDWMVAGLVTGGVVLFMLGGDISPEYRSDGSTWFGIALLLAFIVLDGFTSTFQENLFAENRASKYNQMLYINLCSAAISSLVLYGSGGFPEALKFCRDHPVVWVDICILSGSAVVAQWFIFSQVQEFGAVAFAVTMNLRQMASVSGSYLFYHRSPSSITVMQILGLVLVFGTLGMQSIGGCCPAGTAERQSLVAKQSGKDQDLIQSKKAAASSRWPLFCRAV